MTAKNIPGVPGFPCMMPGEVIHLPDTHPEMNSSTVLGGMEKSGAKKPGYFCTGRTISYAMRDGNIRLPVRETQEYPRKRQHGSICTGLRDRFFPDGQGCR